MMITEHKASHSHENLDQTVSCLIEEAMKQFDETDKIEDLTKLLNRHITEIEKLKAENWSMKQQLEEIV